MPVAGWPCVLLKLAALFLELGTLAVVGKASDRAGDGFFDMVGNLLKLNSSEIQLLLSERRRPTLCLALLDKCDCYLSRSRRLRNFSLPLLPQSPYAQLPKVRHAAALAHAGHADEKWLS